MRTRAVETIAREDRMGKTVYTEARRFVLCASVVVSEVELDAELHEPGDQDLGRPLPIAERVVL